MHLYQYLADDEGYEPKKTGYVSHHFVDSVGATKQVKATTL